MKTFPVYLNGEFVCTAETFPVHNPATGAVIGTMSTLESVRVAQAINDAHAAFAHWRSANAKTRGDLLLRIADELERRRADVARTMTIESGKPVSQSLGEVSLSVEHLKWFAAEAGRAYGRVVPPVSEGKRHLVIKSPVGVVGAISPWNFPLMLAVRKIAPAMAAGCPVLLKPSELTPMTAVAFAECVHAADAPKNVFQLVMGSGPDVAGEFIANPHCRKITFTGSTVVGRKIIASAAQNAKPLLLEMGGLAPVLIFDDADIDAVLKGVLLAKFRNTGQSCIAANRIYVQRGIHDRFIKAFAERVAAMKMGDGLEPDVEIGPLISRRAVQHATEQIADAVHRGARVICGGQAAAGPGNFFQPTVLADVAPDSLCMNEETFAPIAPVCAFESEEEGIRLANNSQHGLAAYVFTRDLNRSFRLMEVIEAGIISINDGLPTTSQAPFGGMKQSGWGRELGTEGLDAFLETKHVSIGI
jgi:succinate-semialdehyde dehydrogenase/glutarate-semialdehyde dehydrogenase